MGHRGLVSGVSFCQDVTQSHICASSSGDGVIIFWDTNTRTLLREHAAHQVSSVAPGLIVVPDNERHFILRAPSRPCTGPRWTRTWWCRVTRKESWLVTGTTRETRPASSPKPEASSASPARRTTGALWRSGKMRTRTLNSTLFGEYLNK